MTRLPWSPPPSSGSQVRNLSNRLGNFSLVATLALAACGGSADPRLPLRDDATPALGTLAAAQGFGAGLIRTGDLGGARAAYEAELAGDPDRLSALNDLAVSYFLDGHLDAARRLLDEVVASGGPREQQAALLNLGELCAVEGHAEAAQAYLESARGVDATRPEPAYALALLADARGDAAGARALLREAVRLDDGSARAALVFAFVEERRHLEAMLLDLAGDRAGAELRWRELAAGRFPSLATAAARRLGEP
ncbi:MAG: tetratricopeptide repeat protein [Anaeromyxobacter sp.]|nr:tetratricopeptide repeat protein [Anaeromyxobacter sp.]MBL0278408.1 tetratricopeptide repeat protein [Anaeromyxobacter sp.]